MQENIYNMRIDYINRLDNTLDINRNLLRNLNEFTRIIEEMDNYNYLQNKVSKKMIWII